MAETRRKGIAAVRAERDAALARAQAAEERADLHASLALRFERELAEQRQATVRELHDEFSSRAISVRAMAATLQARLASREPSLAQIAQLLVSEIDALFLAMRTMTAGDGADAVEHGHLPDALRALVADWRLRKPRVRFELLLEPPGSDAFGLASQAVETAAWRIAGEAIAYCVGRSGTRTVIVSARREEQTLTLQVSDDGVAMPRQRRAEDAALRALRERAQACAASLVVGDGEAGGVEVMVQLPWTV